jgi:hypothetical protein
MRIRIGALRYIIREVANDCWGGSRPEETYDEELVDDDAYKKRSVIVPDDIKKSIDKWSLAMGLSSKSKRARSR